MASEQRESGPDPGSESASEPEPESDAVVGHTWTREDLQRSALAGVAAYAAGYALLYLWFLTDGRTSSEFVDWQWVGWIFHHGQFVPLDVSPGGTSEAAARLVESQLGGQSNVLPALLLSVAAVGIAGFLLARARNATGPASAGKAGASLVLGYLPLAVLGVVVFSGSLPNGIHVRPSPLWSPPVAGLAFPGVVGALGGLAYFYRKRRARDEIERPTDDEDPDAGAPDTGRPDAGAPDAETSEARS